MEGVVSKAVEEVKEVKIIFTQTLKEGTMTVINGVVYVGQG